YKELEAEEYKDFANKFFEAKNLISADRERLIEEVSDNIEKNLILLGATAVEDKLQNGVEGDNAYQFFLQPPNAPAFIGNT
ncbi:phospholipid-transporting ATPase 9-like protein, partial [Trifolium pratense]